MICQIIRWTLMGWGATLKIAWGHHYPGGMVEAWELDKMLEQYAKDYLEKK